MFVPSSFTKAEVTLNIALFIFHRRFLIVYVHVLHAPKFSYVNFVVTKPAAKI